VWDFDDDNILLPPVTGREPALSGIDLARGLLNSDVVRLDAQGGVSLAYNTAGQPGQEGSGVCVNPYPAMGANAEGTWPRGLPLNDALNPDALPRVVNVAESVGLQDIAVLQTVANHDPDVDAVYRLTRKQRHFNFSGTSSLLIPKGRFAPFNAQATLHLPRGFWGMLLPSTVHGRVSDIWRSYAVQRLFWPFGLRLAFTPPSVTQLRTSHDLAADLQAEAPLYLRAEQLVRLLHAWECTQASVLGCLWEEWVLMYEHGFIDLADVSLMRHWISELRHVDYSTDVFSRTARGRWGETGMGSGSRVARDLHTKERRIKTT